MPVVTTPITKPSKIIVNATIPANTTAGTRLTTQIKLFEDQSYVNERVLGQGEVVTIYDVQVNSNDVGVRSDVILVINNFDAVTFSDIGAFAVGVFGRRTFTDVVRGPITINPTDKLRIDLVTLANVGASPVTVTFVFLVNYTRPAVQVFNPV